MTSRRQRTGPTETLLRESVRLRPRHIGVIMDGNRRWGRRHALSSREAYQEGCLAFDRVLFECAKRDIPFLTCFAFSTENWARPSREVVDLYETFSEYIAAFIERDATDTTGRSIRLRIVGDFAATPTRFRQLAEELNDLPKEGAICQASVAINYGARADITRAVREAIHDLADPIDEAAIAARLASAGLPDMDMIIRTGGELRLSNFMLWEAAHAELFFHDCLWPDFDAARFEECLAMFEKRRACKPQEAPSCNT